MVEKFLKIIKKEWAVLEPILIKEVKEKLIENTCEIDFENEKILGLPESLKFGVYYFKITPNEVFDLNKFRKEWESDKTIKKTPRVSLTRFNKRNDNYESFSLYIGKSEKLTSRILEHCFQDKSKTTYGLKLAHRKEFLKKVDLTVSYYDLNLGNDFDKKDKDFIQFIITNLEKKLREELNPWIGKQ